MNNTILEKLNNYYIGTGGLGDLLLSMTTFYDNNEEINLIWFADNPILIKEACNIFSKFKNKLIFSKDKSINLWNGLSKNEKCLGSGITPRELNYSEWDKINIFEKYGVNENPNFVNEINGVSENHICVMLQSVCVPGKDKKLTNKSLSDLILELENENVYVVGKNINEDTINIIKDHENWSFQTNLNLKEQFELIKGSKKVYSVDSWVKTWSSLCGIETYCYDNIYDELYLKPMNGQDFGHNIFIKPFKNIKLIKQ